MFNQWLIKHLWNDPPQHAAAPPTDGTNIPAWRPAPVTLPITAIGGGESATLGLDYLSCSFYHLLRYSSAHRP